MSLHHARSASLFLVLLPMMLAAMFAPALGEDLPRKASEEFVLKSGGNAEFIRVEEVPESELGVIYARHGKAVSENQDVRKNLISEAVKALAHLYTVKARLELADQDVRDKSLKRTLKGEFRGLGRTDVQDKTARAINVRQFPDEKKDEQRLLAFYEAVLDARMFETAALGSIKGNQTLKGTTTTLYRLPAGAQILNLKELDQTWKVDFGGGNLIEGKLSANEKDATVTYVEAITVTEDDPKNLLAEKNETLFENLRKCGSFIIRYREAKAEADGPAGDALALAEACPVPGLDFSGSWSTTCSAPLTASWSYQTLTIAPSVVLSLSLGATITWEHHWVKVSWWQWKYKLKKFECKLVATPGADATVTVSSGAQISKQWSKDIITKTTYFNFSVGFVPVWIVLEGKLKVGAEATVGGVISASAGAKATVTNNLTVKWQNGWSKSSSFSKSLQFKNISADAQVDASATASAPFRVSAYIYYIAGPYAELKPWIKAHTCAQANSTVKFSYDITTGIDIHGGAAMAGWLKSLCDNLPSYNTTFTTVGPYTIASGSKELSP